MLYALAWFAVPGDRGAGFVISSGTRFKVMDEPVYGGMYYQKIT
jgi:hypothetical protein